MIGGSALGKSKVAGAERFIAADAMTDVAYEFLQSCLINPNRAESPTGIITELDGFAIRSERPLLPL